MRTTRILVLLAICVVLLPTATPVWAASCNGASHAMTLASGGATPGTGTTATPVRFSVVYSDNAGCDPTSITVTISGIGTFSLNKGAPTASGGVWYSRTMTLSAGVHSYTFAATSGSGTGAASFKLTSVSPRSVTIAPPTPAPTPIVTPRPPTPAPTPIPKPAPTVAPATPGPSVPTASPTTSPTASPSVSPTTSPGASTGQAGTDAPSPTATEATSPDGLPLSVPRRPSFDRQADVPGGRSGSGGLRGDSSVPILDALVPWTVTTSAGLALFLFLVRRRSSMDGRPLPAVATGTPSADGAFGPATPLPPMGQLVPLVATGVLGEPNAAPAPLPEEAGIPRWLRPSVRQARFSGSRDARYEQRD